MCFEHGFAPKIVQEARELPTIIALVATGLGVAIVPAAMRCIMTGGVRYVEIGDESAHPPLFLMHSADDVATPKVRFLDLLQNSLANAKAG